MPLYEYLCPKCEKVHEIMQKFSDPPAKECPDCGGKIEKQMSLSSFALKGSGWYTSDYKSRPAESKPAESKPAESKPAESKPETQAPDKPKPDKK